MIRLYILSTPLRLHGIETGCSVWRACIILHHISLIRAGKDTWDQLNTTVQCLRLVCSIYFSDKRVHDTGKSKSDPGTLGPIGIAEGGNDHVRVETNAGYGKCRLNVCMKMKLSEGIFQAFRIINQEECCTYFISQWQLHNAAPQWAPNFSCALRVRCRKYLCQLDLHWSV